MGDDSSIVQSARVSYGKGTKKVSTDEGLIKYLMRHWHSTPFEMCEINYHVKLTPLATPSWPIDKCTGHLINWLWYSFLIVKSTALVK